MDNIEDSHESETHTPMEFQSNSFQFLIINGLLRHAQPLRHQPSSAFRSTDSIYKECLKNHVARTGGFALDGCGGYISCPSSPLSLQCEVCGWHRNFHRSQSDPALEYPIFYHAPPPPPLTPANSLNPNFTSPPPLLPYYYPPLPHIVGIPNNLFNASNVQMEFKAGSSGIEKRYRTKFSSEQKVKMLELEERLGWKMQKTKKEMIETFWGEIVIQRSVLKIWMQNHKNTLGKRDAIGVDCHNKDIVGLHFNENDDVLWPKENVPTALPSSFYENQII